MEKRLINITEASKILGIGRNTTYDLVNAGFIPYIDIGGKKVTQASIDEFINTYMGYDFKDIKSVKKIDTQRDKQDGTMLSTTSYSGECYNEKC